MNKKALLFALRSLLTQQLSKRLELSRPAKILFFLTRCGCLSGSCADVVLDRIISEQQSDGGWVGFHDTMWYLSILESMELQKSEVFQKGLFWIKDNKKSALGWGRTQRDIPRIPVTGKMLYFLPTYFSTSDYVGLENLWLSEKNSLTYKAAYTIMGLSSRRNEFKKSILDASNWLASQQNDDGGFSPWKGHPLKSDVFCTAIAIIGLIISDDVLFSKYIKSAFNWLIKNQLSMGLWPYHEIEDGAIWALFAQSLFEDSKK